MIKKLKFGTRTPGWFIIVLDLLISFVALILAYFIRFDLNTDITIFKTEWNKISESILVFFILKFLVFFVFKIHKGLIRHTSNQDLKRIHESHDGIIHIIPIVSKTASEEENSAAKVNLDQDIHGLFKDFFVSRYNQEPNEEILELFREIQGVLIKNE